MSASLAALTLATACATKSAAPPSAGWVSFPLQATSQQPAPWLPPPIPTSHPGCPQCVTGPWMEEQLRKFDDRYAAAAADIRAVLEQTLASMKAIGTAADLKPTAGVGKVNADLTTLTTRIDGVFAKLQTRLKDLERNLADALATRQAAPNPTPAGTASDGLSDALTAIQASPRQTLPLRAWLESHPNHPKAPEALFQLGMAFLDSGYPSAARHYFTRLIDSHRTSLQAAEAKVLLDSLAKPTAKPTRKPAPKAPARASKRVCDPTCQPAVANTPEEIPAAPSPEPAPGPVSAVTAPPLAGVRLTSPATGLQPHPAGTTPSNSPGSLAIKEIR